MKKFMCGNSIVKACFYGLGVSMAIRTVYLDKEGDEVVKINGYVFDGCTNLSNIKSFIDSGIPLPSSVTINLHSDW